MSNYLTPNMNLVIPVPGSELGTAWADDINASFNIIDAHTHVPGSGAQIQSSGLNINADLPINSNNLISIKSTRFYSNHSSLSGTSDIGCLYESAADLYFNDGSGNKIRMTQNGAVAGSSGTITGLPSGTASAAFLSSTFTFKQSTTQAANLDIGSLTLRYPGSYPSVSGNYIEFKAPSSLASGYALTLPIPSLSGTTSLALSADGNMSALTYNQVGQAMTSVADNFIANQRTRTFGSSAASMGGILKSPSSGIASATTLITAIPNATTTLTTTGGFVALFITTNTGNPTVPSNFGTIKVGRTTSNNNAGGYLYLLRFTGSSSVILLSIIQVQVQTSTDSGSNGLHIGGLIGYDYVSSDTHTWALGFQAFNSSGNIFNVQNISLVAYQP